MTTRFLICVALIVAFLGGCASAPEEKMWIPRCHFCGKRFPPMQAWGHVDNDIRLHIDECRRLQRVKDTHELIKVSPKLDSLP